MAGIFEVFVDGESLFRFRLKSPDGMVIAVSTPFKDKPAVVAGIAAARECAGMGLVTDLCPAAGVREPAATVLPSEIQDRRRTGGLTWVSAGKMRRRPFWSSPNSSTVFP
nr:YegP family protein [Arthrobacter sp. MA-N2]